MRKSVLPVAFTWPTSRRRPSGAVSIRTREAFPVTSTRTYGLRSLRTWTSWSWYVGSPNSVRTIATITVLRLEDIKRIPGVQGTGLDELRAEQGIEPLASADELAGEPVADFDAFLELLRTAR